MKFEVLYSLLSEEFGSKKWSLISLQILYRKKPLWQARVRYSVLPVSVLCSSQTITVSPLLFLFPFFFFLSGLSLNTQKFLYRSALGHCANRPSV